jgi:hypothetical protein
MAREAIGASWRRPHPAQRLDRDQELSVQSISRGFSFLSQAWQMAFKDHDLLKPSLFSIAAGLGVTVVGIIPLIGAGFVLGTGTLLGQGVMVALGALLVFAHFVVGYVFSGMTAYLVYGYVAEGDGRLDKAWAKVRQEFWNLAGLAAASTLVKLVSGRMRRGGRQSGAAGLLGGMLGGLLEAVWTEASFLILPAIMIEDANLSTAIKRATQIARGNLLLIGVSTVGVRWITGLIGFVVGAIGLVLGLLVGYGLVGALGGAGAALAIGIALGALVFFLFVALASVIGSYTMTAYNTCLFLWARDVERARDAGQAIQVPAPAPLAAALQP